MMSDGINLLPAAVLRQNRLWYRVRQYSIVWAVISIGCFAIVIGESARMWTRYADVVDLENTARPLRETQQKLLEMRRKLNLLQSRESLLTLLDRMEQPVQIIGIISRSSAQDRSEIQVSELLLSPLTLTEAVETFDNLGQKKVSSRQIERVQLKLEGLGIDDLAVARFVAGLREANVFETVALKSSTRIDSLPGECRRFLVECEFQ